MSEENSTKNRSTKYLAELSLAAIGIVFGDIGTSPLYAFQDSFKISSGISTAPANILGILSLIFWSLILVISFKYLGFVLRADNGGEGGIIALAALLSPHSETKKRAFGWLVVVGLIGASLWFGDCLVTPAISVVSAIGGLSVASIHLSQDLVILITIVILIGLFYFQSFGSGGLGKVFGPLITFWFITLGILGIYQITGAPEVFRALLPSHAIDFIIHHGFSGFFVLGSVFLVVTGGEAIYADIGHFGVLPIRISWFGVVLPGLVLNYFGQGALLLQHPEAAKNPFFFMAPNWALYPVVAIATMATIIASQAVISGSFSVVRQAIQLGFLPRMKVEQTSAKEVGQVYLPAVNWGMMIVCIALVYGFRTSSKLAGVYGVGISFAMILTTLLFAAVTQTKMNWSLPKTIILIGIFLIVDFAFFGANCVKVLSGGWFQLVVAAIGITIMTTWKRGRQILGQKLKSSTVPLEKFMNNIGEYADVETNSIKRVEGTAVYMYSNPKATPPALLYNIRHNKVIH
ncbi:MAG TPA: KUP/HAK/KT family potassium transporter, partial [Balneolaceae bacterium]|nr:KUP/HAK/KT family potassium transporter [Balneolaceae bacterium]